MAFGTRGRTQRAKSADPPVSRKLKQPQTPAPPRLVVPTPSPTPPSPLPSPMDEIKHTAAGVPVSPAPVVATSSAASSLAAAAPRPPFPPMNPHVDAHIAAQQRIADLEQQMNAMRLEMTRMMSVKNAPTVSTSHVSSDPQTNITVKDHGRRVEVVSHDHDDGRDDSPSPRPFLSRNDIHPYTPSIGTMPTQVDERIQVSQHLPARSSLRDAYADPQPILTKAKVGIRDIPTFDPTTNKSQTAGRWLKQVTRVAMAAGWNDQETIASCAIKMDGSAADWFSRVGSKIRTWSEFGTGLKKRYGIPLSRTLVRDLVDNMMQEEKESVDDFIDRIRSVLAPYGEMAEDDSLVGTVFRKGLKPELQRRLTDRFNDTEMDEVSVDDLVEQANREQIILNSQKAHRERYAKANPKGKDAPGTVTTGVGGYTKNDHHQVGKGARDLKDVVCRRCQKKGHYANKCPNAPAAPAAAVVPVAVAVAAAKPAAAAAGVKPVCSHCKKTGHLAAQCWTAHPHLRPNNAAANQRMISDVKEGILHIKGMCPGSMYVECRVGGVLVKGTLDTGAGVSLLHVDVFNRMSSETRALLRSRSGALRAATGDPIPIVGVWMWLYVS